MKRFEFKLQPLLSYRQYLERLAQQNTAKANMNVQNCEKQITYLKQTYDQNADTIENIVVKGVKASEFRRYHDYLDSVESRIEDEKLRKIDLKKVLKEKLLELKKKSVDKKAMEIYREKLKTEYTQEIIKIEQKELDEISSLKTARTLSNETL
ncbi:MAG: flagellar export protein FliJ [Desulfobacula sp.]|uniref:flagellar export protein FliJ n=1 Tax=Desulfobacula sp. TaxID=2593537 RepID=UPI0025BA942E|nr:flagellar export protein FliJ [Desulfobacula sp.]MCD4722757.1 flagellar export protein FliJ [Desulfobacula sp.]